MLIHLCYRAVIATEDNHQYFARFEILETMHLPVYAVQIEVRGMRANFQDRRDVAVWVPNFVLSRGGNGEESQAENYD
jgi:hypothetical protein